MVAKSSSDILLFTRASMVCLFKASCSDSRMVNCRCISSARTMRCCQASGCSLRHLIHAFRHWLHHGQQVHPVWLYIFSAGTESCWPAPASTDNLFSQEGQLVHPEGLPFGFRRFRDGHNRFPAHDHHAPSGSKGHGSKRNTGHDGSKRLLLGGTRILHHAGHPYLCQLAYTSSFLKPIPRITVDAGRRSTGTGTYFALFRALGLHGQL
jgi:hypothetical protein